MYERILVPLDGSGLAEVALPYAEELAGRLGSQVILLHVCESEESQFRNMHQIYIDQMVGPLKRRAEEYRQKAKGPGGDKLMVESVTLLGNPAEEIIEYAEAKDVGLIIMATHGHSGIKRWALGSVADKVIRGTRIPVALIRAKDTRPAVRKRELLARALVPLDGSPTGEAALPYIEELAAKLEAAIVLVQVVVPTYHMYTPEGYDYTIYREEEMESIKLAANDYLEKVCERLKAKGLVTRFEIRVGAAAEEIIKLADEVDADLVAMSTHGRSGMGRWVFGSVADRVLYAGNTPVMLVRAQEAQGQEGAS